MICPRAELSGEINNRKMKSLVLKRSILVSVPDLIFFKECDMILFKEKGVAAIDLEIKTVFLDSGT